MFTGLYLLGQIKLYVCFLFPPDRSKKASGKAVHCNFICKQTKIVLKKDFMKAWVAC